MATLTPIEYNYYIFKPAYPDASKKNYQILEISSSEYKLKVNGEEVTCSPSDKFPLGRDRAILYFYKMAYTVANIVCIIATLTIAGWFLFFDNLLLVQSIIVVAISSRCIDYLERQMRNKSFEIANKVIAAYEKRDHLFDRSEYETIPLFEKI